jgi:hypothetical protein
MHFSLAYISHRHASLSSMLLIYVYLTGVYLIGDVHIIRCASQSVHLIGVRLMGRVSFAGMHLRPASYRGVYFTGCACVSHRRNSLAGHASHRCACYRRESYT